MKKIIVTGGSGFIGSNLVNYLVKKNYFVINIDKLTYSSNTYPNHNLSKKNYKFFKIDINKKSKLKKIIKKYKPECIFNLAAETHVDRSIDSPFQFIHSNILGVYNLLEAIRENNKKNKKIKLVHISTDEVYGDIISSRSNEKFPYNPSSPYSASKASADHLIKSYIRTYKLPAMISNCCNNYGPYQFPEKLIPKMISNILNNKPLPIYAKGQNSREWIHVEDHCEALYKIFKKGKIGETYNIGTNNELENIKICKMICLKINKLKKNKFNNLKLIKFVDDRKGHDLRYAINNNKIKKTLGFRSKYKFENALDTTVKWYLDNSDWLKNKTK